MIGIFDSGYGGLTVLKSFLRILPGYEYLYLGDSARVPYGSRSQEVVRQFAEEGIRFFIKEKVPLVIIACNTMSAVALRQLQEKYSDRIKILGVIRPLAEYAAKWSGKNTQHSKKPLKVGIVGTRATVNSQAYEKEIQKLNPAIKVIGQFCPLLVPLIEEGWHEKPETRMILKKYLRKIKSQNINTLILGCTHYPILQKMFQQIMGKKVHVPDTGKIVAESLKDYLKRHSEIEKKLGKNKKVTLLTTDDPKRFDEFGKIFFQNEIQCKIESAKKISLL